MSAFFAAAMLVQYPVGRVSDRIDRRKILVGGLIAHTAGSLLFAAIPSPGAAVLYRALQGAGAGTVDVANAAIIAQAVPDRSRGRADGALYGSMTAGTAIAPLVGGLTGVRDVRWLFVTSAVCALIAAVPILTLVPSRGREATSPWAIMRRSPLWRDRSAVGAILVFFAAGLFIGVNCQRRPNLDSFASAES